MPAGRNTLIIATSAVLLFLNVSNKAWAYNPSALWQIVSQKCVPDEQQNHLPAPCAMVDLPHHIAVLKDLVGPLQFLLIPTDHIAGIESPALLAASTPNYFADAWQARAAMTQRYGHPIDDSNIMLAINSASGRSQNQFHIHISCIRADVKAQLAQNVTLQPGAGWQSLPQRLNGAHYIARAVTDAEWQTESPFRILASGVPAARTAMGQYGIAMLQLGSGQKILLATRRNLLKLHFASAEALQDHTCAVLPPPLSQ